MGRSPKGGFLLQTIIFPRVLTSLGNAIYIQCIGKTTATGGKTMENKVIPALVFKAYKLGKRRGSQLPRYATNQSGTEIFVPNPNDNNGYILCSDGSSYFGECPQNLRKTDMFDLLAKAREIDSKLKSNASHCPR